MIIFIEYRMIPNSENFQLFIILEIARYSKSLLQLGFAATHNRFIAVAFTARLTEPIGNDGFPHRNTYFTVDETGSAKCEPFIVRI